jgi:hypothetical protein
LRVIHPDRDITDVGFIKAVNVVLQAGVPGRYTIDQIASKLLPSAHTSRRWGTKTKQWDGSIVNEPDPWPE